MNQLDLQTTIVALSSGLAPANRAILRISGELTPRILARLISPSDAAQRQSKEQLLRSTHACSAIADCLIGWQQRTVPARVYYWPDTRSFTGEPSAEIHLLGSLPIVEAMLEFLLGQGAVLANRGEFTLRSFLAGKIDLPQAEAVLGVIEAQAPKQLEFALQQLAGNLSQPVRELRMQLLTLTAHLEAGLDFVEEDIEFISDAQLKLDLCGIEKQLNSISARLVSRGGRARNSQVVLLGLPNAGKSSLFNALLGRERAIVTPLAGTTRDALSARLEGLGESVELVDTAGLEELQELSPRGLAQGVVQERVDRADAILFCIDLAADFRAEWFNQQLTALRERGKAVLVVGTKADLQAASDCPAAVDIRVCSTALADVSVLRQRIGQLLQQLDSERQSSAMHRTMIRCRTALEFASAAIQRSVELLDGDDGEELVAAELRCALEELAGVIGEVHSEDILGEIFSRFCIGK